jgi:hypothetical protein
VLLRKNRGNKPEQTEPASRWPVDEKSKTPFVKTDVVGHNKASLTGFIEKGKTNLDQNGLSITKATMTIIKTVGISLRILK